MKRFGGWTGWVGLISFIVAYDTWAIKTKHETMSQAVWDCHKPGRLIAILLCSLTIKHLLWHEYMPKLDPIGACGILIRRTNKGVALEIAGLDQYKL